MYLGLTSFGGPVAHLGYFHTEFVKRRRWFSEPTYADIVALCQFIPGPASSQVGLAIGALRAGVPGAVAAWLGFTLPSALIMAVVGVTAARFAWTGHEGWLVGFKVVAIPIVAQALWSMARTLSNSPVRFIITLTSALATPLLPIGSAQLLIISTGGLLGWLCLRGPSTSPREFIPAPISKRSGVLCFGALGIVVFGLPILARILPSPLLSAVDSLFRAGTFVFGGGHVVLPLLKSEFVGNGLLTADQFMVGYGAAQAVPGPLFTISAYIGAALGFGPFGVLTCVLAAFLPAMLLIFGAMPFWSDLRGFTSLRAALSGANASVVGLLLAAFCNPVCTEGLRTPFDVVIAGFGLFLLMYSKITPWVVVALTCLACATHSS